MGKIRGKDYDTLGLKILEGISPKRRAEFHIRFTAETIRDLMLSEFNSLKPTPHFEVGISLNGEDWNHYSKTKSEKGLLITDVKVEERRVNSQGRINPRIYALKPDGLCYYWQTLTDRYSNNPLPHSERREPSDLLDYLKKQRKVFEVLEEAKKR